MSSRIIPPKDPTYWDSQALQEEARRVFDICNGCRRCFNLCPSFNDLFDRLDAPEVDGDAEKLVPRDLRPVVELCYQCKLCWNHCPYTPPHHWELDFPRLMLRAKAVQAKQEGVSRQDRLLGNVHLLGKLGTSTAPIANLTNRWAPVRLVMEKTVGVHRDRKLPSFASRTFTKWISGHKPAIKEKRGQVALFYTCYVNYYLPEIGKAAVAVLERNGIEAIVPPQKCCGMPLLDGGDIAGAEKWMQENGKAFADAVAAGTPVVALGPTCSYTIKHEYPFLGEDEDTQKLGPATVDICEYLMQLHGDGKLDTNFVRPLGQVAYHLPCHMKAQNIGFKSRDLLKLVPDTKVGVIDRCSGMDGTWGFKQQYFDLSLKVARKLLSEVEDSGADVVATDCPVSGMQIDQGIQRQALHPVQLVAMAYGLGPDGSPQEDKP